MLTAKEAARATASKMHQRLMPRIDALIREAIDEGRNQVTIGMTETYDERLYIHKLLLALGYEVTSRNVKDAVTFEISWDNSSTEGGGGGYDYLIEDEYDGELNR